jgi:hypothetical protein
MLPKPCNALSENKIKSVAYSTQEETGKLDFPLFINGWQNEDKVISSMLHEVYLTFIFLTASTISH